VEIVKEIVLGYSRVQLLSNHIVRVEIAGDIVIGVNECREMNNAIGELTEGRPTLVLMVPNNTTHFAPGSRDFSASPEGLQFTIADAMVVNNLGQKLLVSFYLKFNKPQKPSKAFNNEAQAIDWLLSL
jgi:hypothetical protein